MSKIRPIAFYLPQYHPIPENDLWWGKGFTEWTNVTKAKPLFRGHYQPHLPADLGFYDLRLPEARQAQADLAKEYGIYGFCYYHYWFKGRRLLERPFNEVLASGEPDFPFCLCWANEHWSRAWDGQDSQVLIKQEYSEEDDRQHIKWLVNAFRDKRYIRYDGKPVFLVYRASRLPNPLNTTSIWREEARKVGVGEIYLCRVESDLDECNDPATIGFDCAVEFQPMIGILGNPSRKGQVWRYARKLGLANKVYGQGWVFDYSTVIERMLSRSPPPYKRFPCVTPSWDNSARRKSPLIIRDSTPDLYQKWLKAIIEKSKREAVGENFIFINAWNEWAEGNHLEPCQKWGLSYLEATRNALLSQ